ncbi:hypothetical protein POUND7_019128 [Theobroma cacao]
MASEISGEYNRSKELKDFDDTKAGVKGLVDAGIVSIPKIFIRPAEELAEELNSCRINCEVPIIDLTNIQEGNRRKEIVDEVRVASTEWGFFQVVNHGIPLSVLDEMIDGVRRFNEQDLESKQEFYSRDPTKKVRFHSNFDLYASRTADWRDTLTLSFLDSDPQPEELPAVCSFAVDASCSVCLYLQRINIRVYKIVSNDKLKSVKHRVVATHVGPRISVPCFFSGHSSLLDKPFRPIKELTSEANPPRYKDVVLREYVARFLSGSLDGKPPIDYYKQ